MRKVLKLSFLVYYQRGRVECIWVPIFQKRIFSGINLLEIGQLFQVQKGVFVVPELRLFKGDRRRKRLVISCKIYGELWSTPKRAQKLSVPRIMASHFFPGDVLSCNLKIKEGLNIYRHWEYVEQTLGYRFEMKTMFALQITPPRRSSRDLVSSCWRQVQTCHLSNECTGYADRELKKCSLLLVLTAEHCKNYHRYTSGANWGTKIEIPRKVKRTVTRDTPPLGAIL